MTTTIELTTYTNISAVQLGDFTGSPTDFLTWMTSENNTNSFTVWGLTNETPAFYYTPRDLKMIVSIALSLRYYYTPTLITFGCLGIIMTLLTIMKSKLKTLPTMHFFIAIATIDLCFLFSLLLWWLGSFSVKLTTFPGWCQFVTFASHVSSFTSVWLHCALAIERYLSTVQDRCVNVCFMWCAGDRGCHIPQQSCLITCSCSTLRVKACIIAIFIIGVVVYVNMCLTVDYVHIGETAVCVPMQTFIHVLQTLSKIDIVVNVFIPYLTIFVLNVRTLYVLIKTRYSRDRAITRSHIATVNRVLSKKAEIQLTVTSFAVCIAFLALNTPSQILRTIYLFQEADNKFKYISLTEYLVQQVFQAIYYTKFAIILPIMLAFHSGFRKAIKLVFVTWYWKVKHVCHKQREPMQLNTLQFTVQFSSTLIRLQETSLL